VPGGHKLEEDGGVLEGSEGGVGDEAVGLLDSNANVPRGIKVAVRYFCLRLVFFYFSIVLLYPLEFLAVPLAEAPA